MKTVEDDIIAFSKHRFYIKQVLCHIEYKITCII